MLLHARGDRVRSVADMPAIPLADRSLSRTTPWGCGSPQNATSPRSYRLPGRPPAPHPARAEAPAEWSRARTAARGRDRHARPRHRASLAILELPSNECRGELTSGDRLGSRRASLGIWVAPGARDRARAPRPEAGRAMVFDACDLKRVALVTDPDNRPMLRAARAAGFLEEGAPGSDGREPGIPEDMAVLSLQPRDLRSPGATTGAQRSPDSRA